MKTQVEREPYSCFVERGREPSCEEVRKALGKACPAWDELERHLAEVYGLKGSFHFMYGQRYGWALRFERGGKLALAMYPNGGHLTVQVVLGRAHVAQAMTMRLPLRVSKALKAAKDYPEGRWLFVPVSSRQGAREMRNLIALKLAGPTTKNRVGRVGKSTASAEVSES
jgi:hypothetical protein